MYSLDNFKKETDKNNSRVLQCFLNVRNPNNKYPFDIIKYDISTKFAGSGWYRSLQRKRDKGLL
jgi:hypothetical protein